jgi:hypothetical protein
MEESQEPLPPDEPKPESIPKPDSRSVVFKNWVTKRRWWLACGALSAIVIRQEVELHALRNVVSNSVYAAADAQEAAEGARQAAEDAQRTAQGAQRTAEVAEEAAEDAQRAAKRAQQVAVDFELADNKVGNDLDRLLLHLSLTLPDFRFRR